MDNRKTKNSGIEWIGEIPEDWELNPISVYFYNRNEKVSDYDYEPLSVTKKGVVPQLEDAAKSNAHDDRKKVCIGDFVINSRSDRKQSCGLSNYDGSVSLINLVLVHKSGVCQAYSKYLLNNYGFAEEFYRWGTGIVADLWSTKWDLMKRIIVAIPNITTQHQIADFLDKKCSQIDELIANNQSQIEKLKEYKQSVITQAVTKGLDPNVETKEEINLFYGITPLKWSITKTLNALCMNITDGPHTTPILYDNGIDFISAEAIKNGKIDFNYKRGYISKEFYDECCLKYLPQKNDIYMVKSGATTGKVAIVDTDKKFTIWSPLAVYRCNDKMYYKYLYYVLQSSGYQQQVQLKWSFGTQQNIGMRVLETILLPMPSIKEQHKIADYLDQKCSQIDSLIEIKQQKIEKLQEYKKSLIYEYVTGKKEVC